MLRELFREERAVDPSRQPPSASPCEAPAPPPDPWLVSWAPAFAAGLPGFVLDAACGLGQNGLWIASLGAQVVGVDSSPARVFAAQRAARTRGLRASFRLGDLETGPPPAPVPSGLWGGILVFHYLDRALLPRLAPALEPGGVLAYKTHLAHPLRPPGSRPRRAAYLLRPGELLAAFPGLAVLDYREWAGAGGAFAALLARRPLHSL